MNISCFDETVCFSEFIETDLTDYLMSIQCDVIITHYQSNCIIKNDSVTVCCSFDKKLNSECF